MFNRFFVVLAAASVATVYATLTGKSVLRSDSEPQIAPSVAESSKSPRGDRERFEHARKERAQKIQAAAERWKKGDREVAERQILALTDASPLLAHATLARLYESAGSPKKAYGHWKLLLLSDDFGIDGSVVPGTALHVAALAKSYGTSSETLALLRRASGKPKNPDPKNMFDPGLVFDYDDLTQVEAAAHVRAARSLDPWETPDAVVSEYLEALELRPDWGDAYYYLGTNLPVSGRHHEAVVALTRAVQLGSPEVKRAASWLLNRERYFDSQVKKGKMVDRTPTNGLSIIGRLPGPTRP